MYGMLKKRQILDSIPILFVNSTTYDLKTQPLPCIMENQVHHEWRPKEDESEEPISNLQKRTKFSKRKFFRRRIMVRRDQDPHVLASQPRSNVLLRNASLASWKINPINWWLVQYARHGTGIPPSNLQSPIYQYLRHSPFLSGRISADLFINSVASVLEQGA